MVDNARNLSLTTSKNITSTCGRKPVAGKEAKMSRVTLQEIADHLGISKFAVSRALTGKAGVSEDTRRSVLSAAEQFGYIARRHRAVSQSIEVIFHDRTVANRELWIDVQHGIEMEATRFGCTMAVRWTDD